MAQSPSPPHHHHEGAECALRGRICTDPSCWQAIGYGLLLMHEDCDES